MFAAALQQPAEARAAFLESACAGDAALRQQVEALLREQDRLGSFLEAGPGAAVAPTIDQAATESLGEKIGHYKLLQQLGEGGMGTVYLAEQTEPVQRRVALKIIKAGMDTRQVIARFEAERQALALMDHPNIAKVLDVGATASGRPFFVMELVKGVPITQYCDQQHLPLRDRLELFVPVCQAIQHAHQKGIIHRDLKPSNVLVALYDGKPIPKVIDFGVAKATNQRLTEKTMFTEIGSIIGTLEYMAPEQAELNNLDIDTRADIYSLGVMLYELLTGSPPFSARQLRSKAFDEMLRVIREEEPPRPSTKISSSDLLPAIAANRRLEPKRLTRLVRGELDWIVMKALEKDRRRRYETASGLALDVQRHLTGEPVHAAPASAVYRLQKFIRQNKGRVLAASLVFAALVAGFAGTTWGLFRANAQRLKAEASATRATQAAAQEREAKQQAETNLALARDSVEKYLSDVTEDPDLKNADFFNLRKKLLESALPFYQKITLQKSDDPALEVRRGLAFARLGHVHGELGESEAAINDFAAAREIFTRLVERQPQNPAYRHELAKMHANVGNALRGQGKHREAEAAYGKAQEIAAGVVAEFPNVKESRHDLSLILNSLGLVREELGDGDGAETAYRRGLASLEQLAAEFPLDVEIPDSQAVIQSNLGTLLHKRGQLEKAVAAYRRAAEIEERLSAEYPKVPRYRILLSKCYSGLSNSLTDQGQREEAVKVQGKTLATLEKLVADFPSVPDYRRDLALAHNNLGPLLSALARYDEAEQAYRHAVEQLEQLVARFPANPSYRDKLGASCLNLGSLLNEQKRPADASRNLSRAISLYERLCIDFSAVPDYRFGLARSHSALAWRLFESGQIAESEATYRSSIEHYERLVAACPAVPDYRNSLSSEYAQRGQCLHFLGKYGEAESQYRRAIAMQEKLVDEFPAVTRYRDSLVHSHNILGVLLFEQAKYEEALACYRQSLDIELKLAADFPAIPGYRAGVASIQNNLGNALKRLNRPDDAESAYREAIQIQEKLAAEFPTHPHHRLTLGRSHFNLGLLLENRGKLTEATAIQHRAVDLLLQLTRDVPGLPEYREALARAQNSLGELLNRQGRREESELAFRQAADVLAGLVADVPATPRYAVDAGRNSSDLANLFLNHRQPKEALDWFDKSIAQMEKVSADVPRLVASRRTSYWGRAAALDALGRHAEAVRDWERAQALDDGQLKQLFQTSVAESRLRACQQAGDGAGCLAAAASFEALKQVDAQNLYKMARLRAVCADVIARDTKFAPPEATRLAQEQADAAMSWLQKSIAAGNKNVARIRGEQDFASLGAREDFQKLTIVPAASPPAKPAIIPAPPALANRIAQYSERLTKDPTDVDALLERAALYFGLNDFDAAAADVNAILKSQPENPLALVALAQVELGRGRQADAIETVQRLLKTTPKPFPGTSLREFGQFVNARIYVVNTLLNSGRAEAPAPAIDLAEWTVKLFPDQWSAHSWLAENYYRLQRWDDAAREFEIAIPGATKYGQPFIPWLNLAMTEHRRGNPSKAQEYLEVFKKWKAEQQGKYQSWTSAAVDDFQKRAEDVLKGPPGEPKKP